MEESSFLKKAFFVSTFTHILIIGGIELFPTLHYNQQNPEDISVVIDIQRYEITPDIKKIESRREIVRKEKTKEMKKEEAEEIIPVREEIIILEETKEQVEAEAKEKEATFLYQDAIKRKIEEKRIYPYIARIKKLEGIVTLRFEVLKNGNLNNINVLSKTPYRTLNDEAIQNIRRAQPFPPFPKEIKKDVISIIVSIVFDLD